MTDYTVGDTINKRFTSRAFATGIPTVLAGTPVVSAYEDDSTTQITAGITLGVDHDSIVGLNLMTVVATGANGYESGKDYDLVITTGTVGGVSVVGEVVGSFTLGRSAAAVDLANGTDGLGAIKTDTAAILVDTGTTIPALLPSALVGGRIDANMGAISADSTAADNAESFFDGTGYAGTNNVIPTVTTLTGNTAQTGDNFTRLGAPAGASVSADIAAMKVDTAAILVDTGTTIPAQITALNDPTAAAIATAVLTTAMTESYAADGAEPTLAQSQYLTQQMLTEFAIVGTTLTVNKLDGLTPAATFTLDSTPSPTAITRAS